MRNISFSLTKSQFLADSKDVTRRLGWSNLKPGDRLMACEKCQGIKKGELVRLGEIEVVSIRSERLDRMIHEPEYGAEEARREGFPDMSGEQFVMMFITHMNCDPDEIVTRMEFRKIHPPKADIHP